VIVKKRTTLSASVGASAAWACSVRMRLRIIDSVPFRIWSVHYCFDIVGG
jgi:hypothetical protein